jgi:hypothetical protein
VYAVSLVDEAVSSGAAQEGLSTQPRFLNTNFSATCGSKRGFVQMLAARWPDVRYSHVFLDYYWLPDSVAWMQVRFLHSFAAQR